MGQQKQGKTILLVEDEAIIALAEQKMLQKQGYQVINAASGEQALEIVASGTEIDLILMDIDLGRGMSGTEAAERIVALHDIPLAFLSSHTEPEMVEKTEGITSYGYIVKNNGNTVLLASIRRAFRLHAAHQAKTAYEKRIHLTSEMLDTASSSILVHDFDGRMLFVNQKACETHGYTQDEFSRLQLRDIGTPESAAKIGERMALIERDGAARFEVEHRRKDGSIFPAQVFIKLTDWGGTPALLSVSDDISERKRNERDQFETNDDLMGVLESLFDSGMLTDPKGSILLFGGSGAPRRL